MKSDDMQKESCIGSTISQLHNRDRLLRLLLLHVESNDAPDLEGLVELAVSG